MKRRLSKLVLFLLLGAIVNVAVAWGCVLWIDLPINNPPYNNLSTAGGEWFARTLIAFGTTQVRSERKKRSTTGYASDLPPKQIVPSWGEILMTPTEEYQVGGPGIREWRVIDGRGWPIRTLWSETSRCVGVGSFIPCERNRYGIPILWRPWSSNARVRSLPLRPIWRGFAVNTGFYAAMLWLVIPGPFTARRFVRGKRDRCINCGYDLRGAEHEVCPECGALTFKAILRSHAR